MHNSPGWQECVRKLDSKHRFHVKVPTDQKLQVSCFGGSKGRGDFNVIVITHVLTDKLTLQSNKATYLFNLHSFLSVQRFCFVCIYSKLCCKATCSKSLSKTNLIITICTLLFVCFYFSDLSYN